MMKVLSHRGYWKIPTEKNTREAFTRSFNLGFGTETDLRDACGKLLISHDPPERNELSFEEMLGIYKLADKQLPLALNVKADGLQNMASKLIQDSKLTNYFFFDMSIPDMIGYLKTGLRFFTRQSELEPEPVFINESAGVWLDMFYSDWVNEGLVATHLAQGKEVCIVSPELHKRDHLAFWESLATWRIRHDERLMICTDLPEMLRQLLENTN